MLSIFVKSINQLKIWDIQKYLWLALSISLIIFYLIWISLSSLAEKIDFLELSWIEPAAGFFGILSFLLFTLIFFVPTVTAVTSFFLEDIANAVEKVFYPESFSSEKQPFVSSLFASLRFFGLLVFLNIAILPFLLILPVFPFVYYIFNGYLIGFEFFNIIALRRLSSKNSTLLRKSKRGQIFTAGIIISLMQTTPFINFFAPVIGTIAMVHFFENWKKTILITDKT